MTIPWMAISSLALDAIGAASSAKTAATDVANKRVVDSANAAAANLVRAANNELASKKGSLDRYNQSVNNQRVMANTGSAIEAATMNYRRARDSATQDDFEQQIKFAEQAGSQAAAAAFSGVQGGVVDVINSTSALRKSRIQQRMDTSLKQGDYDARVRIGNIALQGWDSLDSSVIADNIDHNVNVAQIYQDAPGFWSNFAGKVDLKNVASVTDYVGKTFGSKEKFQWSAPSSYNYGVE